MPVSVFAPAILTLSLLAAAPAAPPPSCPCPPACPAPKPTPRWCWPRAAMPRSGRAAIRPWRAWPWPTLLPDRTLPAGRPQGLAGPLQASQVFHAAVPDLQVAIEEMLVAGVTGSPCACISRAASRACSPRRRAELRGQGQAIDFHAFDLLVRSMPGRISDNWHLEDNLTLLRQLGVLAQWGGRQACRPANCRTRKSASRATRGGGKRLRRYSRCRGRCRQSNRRVPSANAPRAGRRRCRAGICRHSHGRPRPSGG